MRLVPLVLLLTGAFPGWTGLRPLGPGGFHTSAPTSFDFFEVRGASWYRLWVEGESGVLHDRWYEATDVCSSVCTIAPGLALPPGSYRWYVQPWMNGAAGPWSVAFEFGVVASAKLHWIDPLAFRPGTPGVVTSFDALDSGVGSGTSGLIVEAASGGSGPGILEQGLTVPPGMHVAGVRLCYELTDPRSHVAGLRIQALDTSLNKKATFLDHATPFQSAGPVCEDSDPAASSIDPTRPLRLQLLTAFPDPALGDRIVIRGLGLYLLPDPADPANQ